MKYCICVIIQLEICLNFLNLFLTHELFRSLLLISNLIPLCLEDTLCVIKAFQNLMKLVIQPRMWSILMNILYVPEKMYIYSFGDSAF